MSADYPANTLQDADKGIDPDRSPEFQTLHGKIISVLASQLAASGYSVKADHIFWPAGRPDEINGYIPDVTATKFDSMLVFEVETYDTYGNPHTRSQLAAFGSSYPTCVILPSGAGQPYGDIVLTSRRLLLSWSLPGIGVGTCDLAAETISIHN